jgi:DNA-3-methyladenine glycosylase I
MTTTGLPVAGPDGLLRCPWSLGTTDYVWYHDEEWGREVRDDTAMFERLCLEAFQSGLSWLTILRKRENFRLAFRGFDPEAVASFGPDDEARLLADAGIVRNRAKIEAAIANARAALALPDGLAERVWKYAGDPGPAPATSTEGAGEGLACGWVPVHRAGHRLRHHAGLRRRQRSSRGLRVPKRPGLEDPADASGMAGWDACRDRARLPGRGLPIRNGPPATRQSRADTSPQSVRLRALSH